MKKILNSAKSRIALAVTRFATKSDSESGATAVEYAVMLALIIVVCITAVTTLGTATTNTFSYVGAQVQGQSS